MDQLAHDRQRAAARKRRRAVTALLMSLSVATLGAGAISLAQFTDSEASSGAWTAGTIDLLAEPVTVFDAEDIMPGDAGSQTVTVENSGTGELRYALTASATNTDGKDLAGAITLTIRPGACPSAAAAVYSGPLSGSALFGDPAQGDDTGDRVLAAGTSEDLCFAWSFPLSADDSYQGAATTATFTFDAEQTANNP